MYRQVARFVSLTRLLHIEERLEQYVMLQAIFKALFVKWSSSLFALTLTYKEFRKKKFNVDVFTFSP